MSRRRKRSRRVIIIVCLALIAGTGIALAFFHHSAPPERALYTIQLGRNGKIDRVTHVKVLETELEEVTDAVNGVKSQRKHEELCYELDGARKILKTDYRGRVTQFLFTIEQCLKVQGEQRIDLARRGLDVIFSTARNSDRCNISPTRPGETLSDEAKRALGSYGFLVFEPMGADDDCFDLTVPREVGETWPINSKSLGDGEILNPRVLVPGKVAGRVTLKGPCSIEGIDCMEIAADVSIGYQGLDSADRSLVTEDSKISFTYCVPLDLSVPCAKIGRKETARLQRDNIVGGARVLTDVHTESTCTITETSVK